MTWDGLFIGKVIYSTLTGLSGIATRIYPLRIPQETDLASVTAVSYYVVSTMPEPVKDSRSMVDTIRVQVSIFSISYANLNAAAQLIREQLDGLTGEIAGCSVDSVYFDNEFDADYEDDLKVYHRVQEYMARVKNDASVSSVVVSALTLTSDYTWTGAVPAGCVVEFLMMDETAGHTAQLSAGTSAGANDVFSSEGITAGALTVINVNKAFSKTSATTIYINHAGSGDAWNSASINTYIALRKIV